MDWLLEIPAGFRRLKTLHFSPFLYTSISSFICTSNTVIIIITFTSNTIIIIITLAITTTIISITTTLSLLLPHHLCYRHYHNHVTVTMPSGQCLIPIYHNCHHYYNTILTPSSPLTPSLPLPSMTHCLHNFEKLKQIKVKVII